MTRTTLDVDGPVLREIRQPVSPPELHWISRPMEARVDLSDKEAVRRALDENPARRR